jgi:hypothetical protein
MSTTTRPRRPVDEWFNRAVDNQEANGCDKLDTTAPGILAGSAHASRLHGGATRTPFDDTGETPSFLPPSFRQAGRCRGCIAEVKAESARGGRTARPGPRSNEGAFYEAE